MKTKKLFLTVAILLALGISAVAFWWSHRLQVIVLDNGDKLTLLGADYGKRHTPPVVKIPASTNRAAARRNSGGAFTTTENVLVVWVKAEHKPGEYPNYQFYLYDKAGKACVENSTTRNNGNGRDAGVDVIGVEFDAFPRRAGKLVVKVQSYVQNVGQVTAEKKFAISNPAHGPFPTWTVEPLPATKTDGDLSVTLKELAAGATTSNNRNQDDADDAMNKGVRAVFHLEHNGKPVNNWHLASIETSDATGNRIRGWANNNEWQDGDSTITYQWGLWPDEPAWKVKFEFSKESDYDDNEVWTAQNVPLLPGKQQDFWNYNNRNSRTNTPFAETDLNGIHLKIFRAKQFTDVPPNSQPQGGFVMEARPSPSNGLNLKLVKITDDQTNEIESWNSSTSSNGSTTTYAYGLRDLQGVTNINVVVALTKNRYAEFTVKPANSVDQ